MTAAMALGAWVEDGRPAPNRPTPLAPREAIQLLSRESNFVALAAANIARGVVLKQRDLDRLLKAASRINRIGEVFA